MTATKVEITDTEPTSIVKDFSTFLKYIEEKAPSLVRKGHFLPRATLSQISKLMSAPGPEDVSGTAKFSHPYLTLFYYLAVKGNLFTKTSRLHLQSTERLTEYNQLTAPEKYFFLLETFWVDTDWSELLNYSSNVFFIPEAQSTIDYLARTPPGKLIPIERVHSLWSALWHADYLLEYLSFFGVIRITCEEPSEKPHGITSASVAGLGGTVFPILCSERNLLRWNIPYIREHTSRFTVLPGSRKKNIQYEPFFKPFQKFVKRDLQKTLPRGNKKGTYTVKVSLRKNLWRTIVLSNEHTLEDLHEAIQDAFEFDRDHLYTFFTDGIPWSNAHIYALQGDEGPFSNRVSIGDLGLQPGQFILYIFDFGHQWQFKIELLDFSSEPGPPSPVIGERKGKSPEQYPSW
ncbi:MAG: hypothetical protein AYK18_04605 [Theionarchaea archaeon DG-70]|nr:MAG: hypothetical protein AYK18_04605 [Theionarchaea archaeon DG-70]